MSGTLESRPLKILYAPVFVCRNASPIFEYDLVTWQTYFTVFFDSEIWFEDSKKNQHLDLWFQKKNTTRMSHAHGALFADVLIKKMKTFNVS